MATDMASVISGLGGNLAASLGTAGMFALYIMITLICLGLLGLLLWFYFNKKSFKIQVHILRPIGDTGKFYEQTGLLGKQAFNRKKKEVRFQIYRGQKLGLQYNNEAVKPEYFQRKSNSKGKVSMHLYMTPNKEGWLQPTMLTLDASKGLIATVNNADLSYYQTELELMDAMFGNKSFFEKYYLLILCILMVIVVVIQWYAASQIHTASVTNAQAAKLLSDTALQIAQMNAHNSTISGASQVISLG